MAGITLAQAEARLNEYLNAEVAILAKQSYKIADRELRYADLAEIRAGIEVWDKRAKELSVSASGRTRSRTIVARS